MSWFILGLVVGGCLGIAVMSIVVAGRDNHDYIELNNLNEKDNEVEE